MARVLLDRGPAALPGGLSLPVYVQRVSPADYRWRMADGLLVFVAWRTVDRSQACRARHRAGAALVVLQPQPVAQSVVCFLMLGLRELPVLHRVSQQYAAALLPGRRVPAGDSGGACTSCTLSSEERLANSHGGGGVNCPRIYAFHQHARDAVVFLPSAIHLRQRGAEPDSLYR